jgi:hypothetical protein
VCSSARQRSLRPRRHGFTTSKSILDRTERIAGAAVLATAILDRLLHRAHVLNVKGCSDRLRDLEDALRGRATNDPTACGQGGARADSGRQARAATTPLRHTAQDRLWPWLEKKVWLDRWRRRSGRRDARPRRVG